MTRLIDADALLYRKAIYAIPGSAAIGPVVTKDDLDAAPTIGMFATGPGPVHCCVSQQGNEHPAGARTVNGAADTSDSDRLEAERDEARFFADGWHKHFRRVNKARHQEKERAEKAEYAAKENREAMNNAVAAWRKAEAELMARPRGIGDGDIQALFDRAEKAEAEVARLRWTYEPTDEQVDAAMREADAIIPLNEEQAEAFKALSESIKTEQSLRAEVARLEWMLDDCANLARMTDAWYRVEDSAARYEERGT
jgi:hypothetical protein